MTARGARTAALGLTLLAFACSDAKVFTTRYADGEPWSELHFAGGVPDGLCRTWHPGGVLASQGQYRAGAATGRWRYWRADGSLELECTYERDLYHGPWVRRFPGGRDGDGGGAVVEEEGRFEHGVRVGLWTRYTPTGALLERGEYDAGQRTGRWEAFHSDGSLSAVVQWTDGALTGPTRGLHPDGTPAFEGELDGGGPVGPWRRWYADGTVQEEGVYGPDHLRTGPWTMRRRDGTIDASSSGLYERGVRVSELPREE